MNKKQMEYRTRRRQLIEQLPDGIVILPSHSYQRFSNDVQYDFRPQSDFYYYTGFPEPDSIAVIEKTSELTKYTLFVPKRDKEFETWNGRRYGTEGAQSHFHADDAFENTEFEEKLSEILKNYEQVYFPLGENEEIEQIVLSTMKKACRARDRVGTGPVKLVNSMSITHLQRSIKSPYELELMRKTTKISGDAMKLAIQVTKPGMKESQVQSLIEYHYLKSGARRPAYYTIAGSGVNATILHYNENSDVLKAGDLLLVDAGAEYQGYAADITRTWPISGKFTDEQAQIYQLVLDTQIMLIEHVEPGITLNELQDLSHRSLSKGLITLGLLEGDVEMVMEEESYKRFTLHGVGHWLGLDVHDTSLVKKDFEFQPFQIFTIEPGIYIPDDEDIPEQYRGIGVRIEDDILVTSDGSENLTREVPKTIEELEALVGTLPLP